LKHLKKKKKSPSKAREKTDKNKTAKEAQGYVQYLQMRSKQIEKTLRRM